MSELTGLTLKDALEGLKARKFSAVELAQAHQIAIETARGLNAYVLETPEKALAMAEASDARLKAGDAGPQRQPLRVPRAPLADAMMCMEQQRNPSPRRQCRRVDASGDALPCAGGSRSRGVRSARGEAGQRPPCPHRDARRSRR